MSEQADANDIEAVNKYIINLIKKRKLKVKELINNVKLKYSISDNEILSIIDRMKKENKINILKNSVMDETNKDISSNTKSIIKNNFRINIIIIFLTLITVFSILIIPENDVIFIYFRWVLGFIFIIFLPGYSLQTIVFPLNKFDMIEQIGLSFGLSIIISSMVALILNFTPFGLTIVPITTILAVFIIFCNLILIYRKTR